jgi:hypothetical protein
MFLSFNFLSALAISMPQAETPAFRKQTKIAIRISLEHVATVWQSLVIFIAF